jgi:hypothetical protein
MAMRILTAVLFVCLTGVATIDAAEAQWTGQRFGNMTTWNGPQGTMTCTRFGNMTTCN